MRSGRNEGGAICKIGVAAVSRETWDGGVRIVVGADHKKKKKKKIEPKQSSSPTTKDFGCRSTVKKLCARGFKLDREHNGKG